MAKKPLLLPLLMLLLRTLPLLLPICLGLVSALEHCSEELGGGICPTCNTCCLMLLNNDDDGLATRVSPQSRGSSRSSCIPNDLGSFGATCCPDGGRTGCAVGYVCSTSRSSGNNKNERSEDCTAGESVTDPLVQRLPRYRLCHSKQIERVHGFPITKIDEDSDDAKLAYYSSHGDITKMHSNEDEDDDDDATVSGNMIRMAVVVVHGSGRNADDYFCSMTAAVERRRAYYYSNLGGGEIAAAYDDDDSILILAPRFPVAADAADLVLEEGGAAILWSDAEPSGPWRYGANAVAPTSFAARTNFSSYDALDRIAALLLDRTRFPNLDRITVVGHSSGGQFVQRWSLLTSVWDDRRLRGVVINPSSYAYLTPLRYYENEWRIPPILGLNCSDYNQWHWGLEQRQQTGLRSEYDSVPYVEAAIAKLGVGGLRARFATRSLVYLVGGRDVCNVTGNNDDGNNGWCNSHGLETTCRDELQGSNRLERHHLYLVSLNLLGLPHRSFIVPGVGHDHSLMFNSENGIKAIFGTFDDNAFSFNFS